MKTFECGLDAAVDVVGGKWKLPILWTLEQRPHRFGELRRAVGNVSEKVLIQQLKDMEGDGLVLRTAEATVPPRVTYSLTELGDSLNEALEPLCQWGEQNITTVNQRRDARACEVPA